MYVSIDQDNITAFSCFIEEVMCVCVYVCMHAHAYPFHYEAKICVFHLPE